MFGPYVNKDGNGGGGGGLYIRVVRFVQLLKMHGLTSLSDAFLNADDDKLIEIYIFAKK